MLKQKHLLFILKQEYFLIGIKTFHFQSTCKAISIKLNIKSDTLITKHVTTQENIFQSFPKGLCLLRLL